MEQPYIKISFSLYFINLTQEYSSRKVQVINKNFYQKYINPSK